MASEYNRTCTRLEAGRQCVGLTLQDGAFTRWRGRRWHSTGWTCCPSKSAHGRRIAVGSVRLSLHTAHSRMCCGMCPGKERRGSHCGLAILHAPGTVDSKPTSLTGIYPFADTAIPLLTFGHLDPQICRVVPRMRCQHPARPALTRSRCKATAR